MNFSLHNLKVNIPKPGTLKKAVFLFAVSLILWSCASGRKKDDPPSFLGKKYHNITSHYNGYFNANELVKQAYVTLSQQNADNFNQMLDVFDYDNTSDYKAIQPDMNKSIEKLTIVANLHEKGDWVDDCYLLIGVSQYLKHDYEGAELTLQYLKEELNPEKLLAKDKKKSARTKKKEAEKAKEKEKKEKEKARETAKEEKEKARKEVAKERERERKAKAKAREQKKKGKKPIKYNVKATDTNATTGKEIGKTTTDSIQQYLLKSGKKNEENLEKEKKENKERKSYFLKKPPAYYEGLIWLAKTYIKREKYGEAAGCFNQLVDDINTPQSVINKMSAVQAQLACARGRYAEAVPFLENAVSHASNKKEKARFAFILGQIYQKKNDTETSYAWYRKAMKWSPEYVMEINAKLNLMEMSWSTKRLSSEQVRNELEKIGKEEKNADYIDRIYYMMGRISLQQNNKEQAIADLKKSLSVKSNNTVQRMETFYTLAKLYYEKSDYLSAASYFDSTLTLMTIQDDRYSEVKLNSENLRDIALHLGVIKLQDSLIKIALMDPADRRLFAAKLKAERDAAKKEEVASSSVKSLVPGAVQLPGAIPDFDPNLRRQGGGAGISKSTFFAYDEKLLRKGKENFIKYWGNRSLEDNWRRSLRRDQSISGNEEEKGATSSNEISDADYEKILKDVPKTEADINNARETIKTAMLALGRLYRDKLSDNNKSIQILEELCMKYPGGKQEVEAWYLLYVNYKELGQSTKAQEYADKILGNYPDSIYAQIIRDPNYALQSKNKKLQLNDHYLSAFQAFESGNYPASLVLVNQVDSLFPSVNPIRAKYALLGAMLIGKTVGKEKYIEELKDVVGKYPNSNEEKRAREMLRILGDVSLDNKELPNEKALFFYDEEKLHYVIFVYNTKEFPLEETKLGISNFNSTYYNNDKLRTTNINLDLEVAITLVRKFDNAAGAMDYYQSFIAKKKEFFRDPKGAPDVMVISQDNYPNMLKQRDIKPYKQFFERYYLKK